MDWGTSAMWAILTRLKTALAGPHSVATWLTLIAFLGLMLLVESRRGQPVGRYLTRGVRTDAAYAVFYAGFFGIFVWAPLLWLLEALVHRYVPFLELGLLSGLPLAHYVIFLVVTDFANYWKHRLMHTNRFLWAFHQIHHSQEDLTFLTAYRFHAIDEVASNVVRFGIGLVLGIPALAWLPLTVVLTWYQSVQHSDTGWSYGPLDTILVSSRFHNIHHSTERVHYEKNFGLMFSLWDVLFRTAEMDARRPEAYGISGTRVPESFTRQVLFPFRVLATEIRRARSTRLPGSATS